MKGFEDKHYAQNTVFFFQDKLRYEPVIKKHCLSRVVVLHFNHNTWEAEDCLDLLSMGLCSEYGLCSEFQDCLTT